MDGKKISERCEWKKRKAAFKASVFVLQVLLVGLFLTGCYAMPSSDDFSVVPSTNNPDYTGRVPQSMPQIPGGGGF